MMFISKNAAQAIVEEIGNEINEHINMMDEHGVIIASTNPERIGQVHEGARRIVTEHLPELYVTEDMETETTRKGTNLPLIVRDQIVGVVGITGDRERVQRYGNIVRRMTEIMIEDSISKDVQRYDRRMKYRYIEEWISKSNTAYSSNFIERGKNLGIDIQKEYRVLSIHFYDYQKLSDTLEGQRILDDMENSVRHEMENRKILYLRQPPRQICILPVCSDAEMEKMACNLKKLIEQKFGRRIFVGIDSCKGNKHDLRQMCLEAERAVDQAMMWDEDFFYYDHLNIELFLNEISEATMQEYLKKLFANISEEKMGEFIQLIEYYFNYEGSIGLIADAMFMHKNTLQYKLKKLTEATGKDLRLPSNSPIFYMALTFYHKIYGLKK